MALSKKRLAKELVRATLEFHALKPWEAFGNEDIVALDMPGLDDLALASIMGAAGQEFGLNLFLGKGAAARLIENLLDDAATGEWVAEENILGFSLSRLEDIPPSERSTLDLAGFQGRKEAIAPWVIAKNADRHPHRPGRDDLEILLYAVRGLIFALEDGLVESSHIVEGDASPLLVLSGDPRRPDVRAEAIDLEALAPGDGPTPEQLPPELAELPRRPVTWQVGYPVMPVAIDDDDRTVRGVFVLEPESGLLLGAGMVTDPAEAGREFSRIVLEPAAEIEGAHLPRRILFRNPALFRILAPGLRELGVEVSVERVLPELEEAVDEFAARIAGPDTGLPAPDDLEGWKEVNHGFTSRVHILLGRDLIKDPRALRAFFGSSKRGWKLFDERFDEGTGPGYLEWLLAHHRPVPAGPRTGELILSTDTLTLAEKTLLRARLRGRVSIYRLEDFGPEGRVGLVDVLDGSRHEIRDFTLAENEEALDSCAPLQIFSAGNFQLGSLLGPALSRTEVDEALDFLESLVSPLTPEVLTSRPGIVGRLWSWREGRRARPDPEPWLVNCERHDISYRETVFRFDDPEALRQALLERDDFLDEEGERLLWTLDHAGGDFGGARLVERGMLEFEGNEVTVETNSVERMDELRGLLLAFPGAEAGPEHDVTPPEMRNPASRKSGADIREIVIDPFFVAGDDPEDAAEYAARQVRRHYLEWPDMEIPDLGGKTPRQVCETEEGRRRIRRRILALARPPALRDLGLDLPREEMLRDLGLLE
ncbi:MAG: hypothetical protein ABFS86_10135 [Planctomycetota bacterium]